MSKVQEEIKPNRPVEKDVGGRPTEYKPEYDQKLIEHMNKGFSFESFAGVVSVTRATVYNWLDQHPSFLDAKDNGRQKSLLFWETQGIDGLWDKIEYGDNGKITFKQSINTGVFALNMRNRFAWSNMDRPGADEGPKVKELNDEQKKLMEQITSALLKANE